MSCKVCCRICQQVRIRKKLTTFSSHTKILPSHVNMQQSALATLKQKLSQSAIASLKRNGYLVIDDAISLNKAHDLLSELRALKEFNILYPCHTHVVDASSQSSASQKTNLIVKKSVWELELHSCPELQAICTDSWNLLHDGTLCEILNNYTNSETKAILSRNNGNSIKKD